MTSLDEALRALETDCRAYARVSAKVGMPGVENDFLEVANRIAEVIKFGPCKHSFLNNPRVCDKCGCKSTDESTRQEVAPVAWISERELLSLHAVPQMNLASHEVLLSASKAANRNIPLYTTTGQTSDARDINERLEEYADGYEMVGETEDGRDACYTPNERERALILDALRGWESER